MTRPASGKGGDTSQNMGGKARKGKEKGSGKNQSSDGGKNRSRGWKRRRKDIMAKEREELRRLASLTDSEGSQKLSREDKYDDSRKAAKRWHYGGIGWHRFHR